MPFQNISSPCMLLIWMFRQNGHAIISTINNLKPYGIAPLLVQKCINKSLPAIWFPRPKTIRPLHFRFESRHYNSFVVHRRMAKQETKHIQQSTSDRPLHTCNRFSSTIKNLHYYLRDQGLFGRPFWIK